MNVCPECRAGKEFIKREFEDTALLNQRIDYECIRCGYESTETVEI